MLSSLITFRFSALSITGLANCALLGWDSARRIAALPRTRAGRLPLLSAAAEALACAARCALAAAPFFLFQAWAWRRFCAGAPWGDTPRPWCAARPAWIYTFVQDHYWCVVRLHSSLHSGYIQADIHAECARRDVGFLRYWRAAQIPNFALAAPVLLLTAAGVAAYVRADARRALTLGLITLDRPQGKPQELTALEEQARKHIRCGACAMHIACG